MKYLQVILGHWDRAFPQILQLFMTFHDLQWGSIFFFNTFTKAKVTSSVDSYNFLKILNFLETKRSFCIRFSQLTPAKKVHFRSQFFFVDIFLHWDFFCWWYMCLIHHAWYFINVNPFRQAYNFSISVFYLGIWFSPFSLILFRLCFPFYIFVEEFWLMFTLFILDLRSVRNTQTLYLWTFAISLFTKFSDPFKWLSEDIFTALATDPKLGKMLPGCKFCDEQSNYKLIMSNVDLRHSQKSSSLLYFGSGLTSAFPLSDYNKVFFFFCIERGVSLTIYWLSTIWMKPNISSSKYISDGWPSFFGNTSISFLLKGTVLSKLWPSSGVQLTLVTAKVLILPLMSPILNMPSHNW